jgi:HNH endonuclease
VAGDRPRHPLYEQVAERARHRCEYCLAPEELSNKEFQVEHISPRVRGGSEDLNNLALACIRCNLSKAAAQIAPDRESMQEITLFNPRTDDWSACFSFVLQPANERALIEGNNAVGRATVRRLRMNTVHAAGARWRWFLAYALETEYLND